VHIPGRTHTPTRNICHHQSIASKRANIRQRTLVVKRSTRISLRVDVCVQANYAAAKGGVLGMTKAMAKEFATRGVTGAYPCPTLD
jgi:NAD(P)-dependent dehydrogenase (short-subunit alcohol dehydrogenase family)